MTPWNIENGATVTKVNQFKALSIVITCENLKAIIKKLYYRKYRVNKVWHRWTDGCHLTFVWQNTTVNLDVPSDVPSSPRAGGHNLLLRSDTENNILFWLGLQFPLAKMASSTIIINEYLTLKHRHSFLCWLQQHFLLQISYLYL